MLDNVLRKVCEPCVSDVSRKVKKIGFHPNTWTLLSLPFAIGASLFLAHRSWALALLFALAALLCDVIDGAIARSAKQVTAFGNYLDAMVDRVVEIAFYLGLAFTYPLTAFLAMSGSFLVSYAKARASLVKKIGNRDVPVLGERFDRMAVLLVGMFLAIFLPAVLGVETMNLALALIAALAYVGSVQRFFSIKQLLGKD
ncbi:MAG: CDP-alcohol phosphatidyltransferase family protein [Nanoarchaeota archaeon]